MHAPLRAVLFDMDGLMLDTETLAMRAWHETAAALGVEFDAGLCLCLIGHNFAACAQLIRTHYANGYPVDALLGGWHVAYDAIVAREGVALKAGVHELLDWLDAERLPRAIATSTRRARAESKLVQAGLLARFDALVGGDEVAHGKPAPDIYLEAARRLAVEPAHCVVLEDSEPGVRAGLAAGMTVIMVPDLVEPSAALAAQCRHVARSLHEARAHLARPPDRAGYNPAP
jgi:HAD superfamily hydrolase (TIGR01509 family)